MYNILWRSPSCISLGRAWASPTVARTSGSLVSVRLRTYVRPADPTKYACAHTETRVLQSTHARTLEHVHVTFLYFRVFLCKYKWDRPNSDCNKSVRSTQCNSDCNIDRVERLQRRRERDRQGELKRHTMDVNKNDLYPKGYLHNPSAAARHIHY